jgi:hypothetical protein
VKQITALKITSEEKRKEMKISEDLRLTTIARGMGFNLKKK